MKKAKKQKKQSGRPAGSKGTKWSKGFKHLSLFSGEHIPSKVFNKEQTAYNLLEKRNLLGYMSVNNPEDQEFRNNQTLKAIAVIKGMEVKDLIKEVIGNYIRWSKYMLKTNQREVE